MREREGGGIVWTRRWARKAHRFTTTARSQVRIAKIPNGVSQIFSLQVVLLLYIFFLGKKYIINNVKI